MHVCSPQDPPAEHGITLYSTRDSREHLLQMDAFELW